jgi:hypothetical protein
MDIAYIYKCRYETQEQKFWYDIPTNTGPFRALSYTHFACFYGYTVSVCSISSTLVDFHFNYVTCTTWNSKHMTPLCGVYNIDENIAVNVNNSMWFPEFNYIFNFPQTRPYFRTIILFTPSSTRLLVDVMTRGVKWSVRISMAQRWQPSGIQHYIPDSCHLHTCAVRTWNLTQMVVQFLRSGRCKQDAQQIWTSPLTEVRNARDVWFSSPTICERMHRATSNEIRQHNYYQSQINSLILIDFLFPVRRVSANSAIITYILRKPYRVHT